MTMVSFIGSVFCLVHSAELYPTPLAQSDAIRRRDWSVPAVDSGVSWQVLGYRSALATFVLLSIFISLLIGLGPVFRA